MSLCQEKYQEKRWTSRKKYISRGPVAELARTGALQSSWHSPMEKRYVLGAL
jgi:hypothetical protein